MSRRRTIQWSRRPSARLDCELLEHRCLPATFWVTEEGYEQGSGSLRQAILDANANPGKDTIAFNISNQAPHVIVPGLLLPEITNPVVIDGTTQPGFVGEPLIVLWGSGYGWEEYGLRISTALSVVKGLAIGNFGKCAIDVGGAGDPAGPGYNVIAGNYIGTLDGVTAAANHQGICVHSSHNTIGGMTNEDRNVISGNQAQGIVIYGSSNHVQGNYIGTDKTGTAKVPNDTGIEVGGYPVGDTIQANLIGGTDDAGNLISGNDKYGILLKAASIGTVIQGNHIGTDASGAKALGNGSFGIFLVETFSNTIGGTTSAARNVISGNGGHGINVWGWSENKIQGNYIGTNKDGTVAVPNLGHGIQLGTGAQASIIGGGYGLFITGNAGNVISGNALDGVHIASHDNLIYGNIIGLNASGDAILNNGGSGIYMGDFSGNNAVGREPDESGLLKFYYGNIIAGNLSNGIRITDGSDDNTVRGNTIGIAKIGVSGFGNGGAGVYITGSASDNSIGGPNSGMGNTIAGNGGAGVLIHSGAQNAVLSNSISDNVNLGINLGLDGVTANDLGDGDTGANELQNFPIIISAVADGNLIIADVTLNSIPNTVFRVDFYGNSLCDESGYGEGATVLGAATMATNAQGDASATVYISASGATYLTANATDPFNNTSEFSACQAVSGGTDGLIPPLWNMGVMGLDQGVPSLPSETREFRGHDTRRDAQATQRTREDQKPGHTPARPALDRAGHRIASAGLDLEPTGFGGLLSVLSPAWSD